MKAFVLVLFAVCLVAAQPQERYKRATGFELHQAINNQNEAEALKLIEDGADINFADDTGHNSMHLAAKHGLIDVVKLLIDKGHKSQLSSRTNNGEIPLHWAAWEGHRNVVELLLENGSDINARNVFLNTAIHWASWSGRDSMVKLLIEKGSKVNVRNNDGDTPFHFATRHDNEKVSDLLLKNGAEIHSRNNNGETSLYWAIWNGRDKVVRFLINAGSNVNAKNNFDNTPLHWAAWGRESMVNLLIEKGSRVQAENNEKDTPLHFAAREGNEKATEILIENGANIHAKNVRGHTPRDIAIKNDFRKIVDLLDNTRPKSTIKIIERVCEQYSVENPIDFILEGRPAKPEEFPWMAALGYLNPRTNSIEFKCAGTIISEDFIMTAAHCTKVDQPPVIVRLGTILLSDSRDAKNYFIKEIIRHQSYSPTTKKNDIALIRLTKKIIFTPDIRPACLETNTHDENPSAWLNVTGWGSTSTESTSLSDTLLKTEVVTVPLSLCNTTYLEYNQKANNEAFQSGISESQYCAYGPNMRGDICRGDSGGPLQIFKNSYTPHVIGIVSFGINCGSTLPGIHTRVAYYSEWITTHVWPNAQ